MSKNTEFGAGIFDEPAKVELTEREIAIAKGEDPDAINKDSEASDESEDTAGESEGKNAEVVAKAGETDVFSDEDRELATKHGLTDDELNELGSPEALRKAVAIAEKLAAKTGAKSGNGESGKAEANQDGAADKPASDAAGGGAVDTPKNESELLGSLKTLSDSLDQNSADLDKIAEEWGDDPNSAKVVKALAETQKAVKQIIAIVNVSAKSQIEAVQQEQNRKAVEVFHDTLDQFSDEFGLSKKDGKPVSLTKEQAERREKVRDAAETLYSGLVAQGKKVPPIDELVKQAVTLVTGVPRKTEDKRQKLVQQSSLRRTTGSVGGAQRRVPPPNDGSAKAIASHPEIESKWKEYQEANGAF